ncbi:uncharacterized protein LOC110116861 [Athalia rosae]|uniref:uncharacterized protein LOC110116861 n=1 Tax=Athalia rosae TaxID=37344 RepID=UPI0020342E1E|nr:uncharacterized protein LOC110116861 [Athalia rosae]
MRHGSRHDSGRRAVIRRTRWAGFAPVAGVTGGKANAGTKLISREDIIHFRGNLRALKRARRTAQDGRRFPFTDWRVQGALFDWRLVVLRHNSELERQEMRIPLVNENLFGLIVAIPRLISRLENFLEIRVQDEKIIPISTRPSLTD